MNKFLKFSLIILTLSSLYYLIHVVFISKDSNTSSQPQVTDGSFTVPKEILEKYKIQTSKLGYSPEFERIVLPGVISYDLKNTAQIGSRLIGRIEAIFVNEGDSVKKGQNVLSISSIELGEMEARYKKSVARKEALFVQLERARELYEKKITSAKEYESILMEFKTAKTEADNSYNALISYGLLSADINQVLQGKTYSMGLLIRSPISGTITERNAVIGQSVSSEDILFTVSNLSTLWVLLEIFEKDLNQVKVGQFAEISPLGSEEKTSAKVAYVGEVIDATTRSAEIRLELENSAKRFRPGQSVSSILEGVKTPQKEQTSKYTLPSIAVHRIEGTTMVFVIIGEGKFQAKEVSLGKTIEDRVEILSGVSEEDEVVTEGSFILKSQYLKI